MKAQKKRKVIAVIKCPVHTEETPSCIVHDDGYMRCLSCQACGDADEMAAQRSQRLFGTAE